MEICPKVVKFVRKTGNYSRTIYIPRDVIDFTLFIDPSFDSLNTGKSEESVIGTMDDWVLSVNSFKGKSYFGFTRMDQNGKRIG